MTKPMVDEPRSAVRQPPAVSAPGLRVHVQHCASTKAPDATFLERCAREALDGLRDEGELTLRIVERGESRALNLRWRGIDRPTNVLSFPMCGAGDVAPALLGDVVICAPLVHEEADAQGKTHEAHWAHLVVHGVLHLLGYDHEAPADADSMENTERRVLARLGYADPYA